MFGQGRNIMNSRILNFLTSRGAVYNPETCQRNFESVLVNYHVGKDTATTVVANSLPMMIGRGTLHSYISLINHVVGINNTRGWKMCVSHT